MADHQQGGIVSGLEINRTKGTVTEPAREIPIAKEFDVVVCGGGPAGLGAAVGAACQGANTLLVEHNAFLGGAATAVMMNTWNVPPQNMSGLAREMVEALVRKGHAVDGVTVPFDPEWFKEMAVDVVGGAGVKLLFYTDVAAPLMDGDRIVVVVTESKSGRQAILAKAVVDATGDGDVAYRAGVPTVKGRESDGKMRPVTTLFRLGGVDVRAIVEYSKAHRDQFTADPNFHIMDVDKGLVRISGFFDIVAGAREKGEVDKDCHYIRMEGIQVDRGIVTLNSTRVYGVDGTDAWDLTRAEIEARHQMRLLYRFIKTRLPGCENAYIIDTSPIIGVRETDRIPGQHPPPP